MTRVKIARLKSQLSRYLRRVQKGEEVIVTDRDTPIARMVPFESKSEKLIIIPAKKSPKYLDKIKVPPAPGTENFLKYLREDRDTR